MTSKQQVTLVSRLELLELLGISDSTERRGRQSSDWPPHIMIRKSVYYNWPTVEKWLLQRENND